MKGLRPQHCKRGVLAVLIDICQGFQRFGLPVIFINVLKKQTSAFSWQNSISLCLASFRIPRTNLPVTPGVSWLPTFAFQSPIVKRTSFLAVSSKRSCWLHQIPNYLLIFYMLPGKVYYCLVIPSAFRNLSPILFGKFLSLHSFLPTTQDSMYSIVNKP